MEWYKNLHDVSVVYTKIPLRNKYGVVIAHALVDLEDFNRINEYRWCLMDNKYVVTNIPHPNGGKWKDGRSKKVLVYLHRFILDIPYGDSRQVDHKNRKPLDCQKHNLRICTPSLNLQNQGSRPGTSKYRGVYWNKRQGKWMARVGFDYRMIYLGVFIDEDEAGRVASEWRLKNMPFSIEEK